MPDEERDLIKPIIKQIFQQKIRKLSLASDLFKDKAPNIYKKLSIWHSDGKYSFIFDHEKENDININLINSVSFSKILLRE